MGKNYSKESETINWNNIKTNEMSSTIPNMNGISIEAKELISRLNLPEISESKSEFNVDTIFKSNSLQNTNKKIYQMSEIDNSSPFISSEMYNNLFRKYKNISYQSNNNNLVGGNNNHVNNNNLENNNNHVNNNNFINNNNLVNNNNMVGGKNTRKVENNTKKTTNNTKKTTNNTESSSDETINITNNTFGVNNMLGGDNIDEESDTSATSSSLSSSDLKSSPSETDICLLYTSPSPRD